ncbi:S-adenosyl-L-methionine-dependent methyltransferase [Amylostereum chailletii]|nr:S-adenosyl-L-methionine-dependent methyltransferase [Amylostereum chailletii]
MDLNFGEVCALRTVLSMLAVSVPDSVDQQEAACVFAVRSKSWRSLEVSLLVPLSRLVSYLSLVELTRFHISNPRVAAGLPTFGVLCHTTDPILRCPWLSRRGPTHSDGHRLLSSDLCLLLTRLASELPDSCFEGSLDLRGRHTLLLYKPSRLAYQLHSTRPTSHDKKDMSADPAPASTSSGSTYWHKGHASETESIRLDALHRGLTAYMDGKLTFAPLKDPKNILELGAGTGTWAIETGLQFPSAKVLATDISPLSRTDLPSNVTFQLLDVLQPINLPAETYDVVHARFLFVHLPNPSAVISRVSSLVKPGGWFTIEDVSINDKVEGDAPGIKAAYKALVQTFTDRGQIPSLGSKLESFLKESNNFSEVNIHNAVLPISPPSDDAKIAGLADTLKTSWNRSFSYDPSPACRHEILFDLRLPYCTYIT